MLLVIDSVTVAPLFTFTVMTTVTRSPGLSAPNTTETEWELLVAVPFVEVTELTSMKAGKESESMALAAGALPVFETLMVKVMVWFTPA